MTLASSSFLNPEKQNALEMLKKFVSGGQEQIFVLTGYAGTGKTTLVKFLAQWCRDNEIPITLLASTGRAAKVLASRAGFTTETVHRLIYSIDVSELDEASKTKKVSFRLNKNLSSTSRIYVIDESSMISDKPLTQQSLTMFGTGSLLDDIFTYLEGRKVIFVGDSAQLPPVNARFSPALSLSYLVKKFSLKGSATNLTQVMRFSDGDAIAQNAQTLLQVIRSENYSTYMKIRAQGMQNISVSALDSLWIEDFTANFRRYGYENCIMLVLSNKMAGILNRRIRHLLYGANAAPVQAGEILMVQQNNYMLNIANGDHVEVLEITGPEERKAGLVFLPVKIQISEPTGKRVIDTLLMKDYLAMEQARLSNEAEFKLMLDFIMRMRSKGLHAKKNKTEYTVQLLSDPYINALRARYGYAVTCHKAQGGEWPYVYIMLEKGLWHPGDPSFKFKWTYTAITRSQRNLFFLENIAIQ